MSKAFDIGFGKAENEITLDQLSVQGSIPEWLSGDLFRNGPGTFHVGEDQYNHWFDGLAMLHRFSFSEGKVSYQNKYLDGKAYQAAKKQNRIVYPEFGTEPADNLFGRIKSFFKPRMTDSAKVNVDRIGEKFLALNETPMQVEFDPKTLDSKGIFNYDRYPGRHITTVHPHFDRFKNKSYNLTTRFNRLSKYRILEVEKHQDPRLIASIPTHKVAYMHSFGMSENYFIITEFPYRVNPVKFLFSKKPFIEHFQWNPDGRTQFYIADRRQPGKVITLNTGAFFAFHHVNAFEQEGKLFVDILAYDDTEVVDAFYLRRIKADSEVLPGAEFRRYEINFNKKSISYDVIGNESIELTHFNKDHFNMDGNYRFVYGTGVSKEKPQSFYNQLVKINLAENSTQTWFEEGSYPGEPIFVPRPGGEKENDGVLLSVVLNEEKENAFLLVLDPQTFTEIARAEVPQPILFGYHGFYTPAS